MKPGMDDASTAQRQQKMAYFAALKTTRPRNGARFKKRNKSKMANCKQCGSQIGDPERKLFCSTQCKTTWHNQNRSLPHNVIYNCEICGKHVSRYISPCLIRPGSQKYCSVKCRGTGHSKENSCHWKGGEVSNGHGHIYAYAKDHPFATKGGYVMKHRLVMEKKIGRYLKKEEVVHHIDGNRSNNKTENLQLCASASEHSRLHHGIRERDSLGRYVMENREDTYRERRSRR